MTNDPIEDLFRNEAVNNTTLEKPRDIVWNKISKELPSKKQTPIKAFVESVWFAAAIFGIIAIPYFYFFIENLNNNSSTTNVVNEIVKHQLEIPQENLEDKGKKLKDLQPISAPVKNVEIVKNSLPKPTVSNQMIDDVEQEVMSQSIDQPTARMNAVLMSAGSVALKIDSTNQQKKDSIKIQTNKTTEETNIIVEAKKVNDSVKVQNKIINSKTQLPQKNNTSQPSTQNNKEQGQIKLNRNKFSYIDNVHKVRFELIKKKVNEQKFKSGDVEFKLVKENNQILLITNSKNIKQEIINQIQLNKDRIFNHFNNRKDFSNVR